MTEAERSTLSSEFQTAEQRLKTADRDKARQIVANMLAGFAGANRSDAEHEAELKRYEFAVAGFPAWAIVEACGAFMRGEIEREQHRFAPTPAEVSVVLRRIVQPLRTYWYERRELLRAEAEAPPAERERNVERVNKLFRGFAQSVPSNPQVSAE